LEEKIGRRKVAMREARRRCGSGPREEAGEVRAARGEEAAGEVRATRIRVEEEAGAGEGAPREEAGEVRAGRPDPRRGRRRARARYAGPDPQAICMEDCGEEEAGEGARGTTFAGGRTKAGGENVAPKQCPLFSLFSCRRLIHMIYCPQIGMIC
jgi:hypothetical protein